MEKYLLFGWLPIRISTDNDWTWTADTGNQLLDCAANAVARILLGAISAAEALLDTHIPVDIRRWEGTQS